MNAKDSQPLVDGFHKKYPFLRVDLFAGLGEEVASRLIMEQKARRFTAEEALAMGLVNSLVPAADLQAKVSTLAEGVAANAPLTVRAAKLTIDALVRHPEAPDTSALDAAVDACFDSADYAEGRRAFLEKRKPRFEGR